MATVVSIPPVLYTSLRSVEYTFAMPSIGVDPIEKYLLYRLKNVTDGEYLTEWKTYRPTVDGQEIKIDFYKDLEGITEVPAPPLGAANVVFSSVGQIKSIEVEYGEREIDKSNDCAVTDTVEGTTDRISVLGGIWRPWEAQFPTTGFLMTNRPREVYQHFDSWDWVCVAGTYSISIAFFGPSGGVIGSQSWFPAETFPNSAISIVPIGFQMAPAGTQFIEVYATQIGLPNANTDLVFRMKGYAPGCEEGALHDVYFSNHFGGFDLMSFDCVQSKSLTAAKEYRSNRYDKSAPSPIQKGQIRTTKNNSFVTYNYRKQFDRLVFTETEWLDSFLESSRVWIRRKLSNGADYLFPGNIVDGSYETYGDEIELNVGIQFSEERINPI
jgi:hypothetical protein